MGPAIALVTLLLAVIVTAVVMVAALIVADVPHDLIGLHLS